MTDSNILPRLTPQQRLEIAELRQQRLDQACEGGASQGMVYGAGAGGALGGLFGLLGGPIGAIRGAVAGTVVFGAAGAAVGCPLGIGLQHLRDNGALGPVDWNAELHAARTPRATPPSPQIPIR